jgi:Flp pilus assembly protein TadD
MKAVLRWTTVSAVAVLAVSCGRPDDQRTDSVDPLEAMQQRASWDPVMAAHVDSGNAAIRADSLEVARRHFMMATEIEPDVAAGWFGLYMAERGLGRSEEALVALERAQQLVSGASLIHPTPEDTLP